MQVSKTPFSSASERQPTEPCFYCNRDHWNDRCVKYYTAEERKERLKWRCYICLLSDHRPFKCLSTKQKCFIAKGEIIITDACANWNFGALQHDSVKSTSPKEATQQHSRGKQEQTPEHKESASEQTEIEIIQSNKECEYYLLYRNWTSRFESYTGV